MRPVATLAKGYKQISSRLGIDGAPRTAQLVAVLSRYSRFPIETLKEALRERGRADDQSIRDPRNARGSLCCFG
jgi:hypothetical protein